MKATSALLALSLSVFLVACQKNEIGDEKPSIRSISFAGIPDEDVMLDQKLRQITIKVPALLPAEGLIPTLELTRNSVVSKGLTPNGKLDLTRFCECGHAAGFDEESHLVISTTAAHATDYSIPTIYNVALITPPGCPEPNSDLPVSFTRHKTPYNGGQDIIYLNLPIRNLYQSTHIDGVFLKNMATGQTYSNLFYEVPCINQCDNDSINRLTVPFDTKLIDLPTGTYEVSIRSSCEKGKVPVVFPTRITFNR